MTIAEKQKLRWYRTTDLIWEKLRQIGFQYGIKRGAKVGPSQILDELVIREHQKLFPEKE